MALSPQVDVLANVGRYVRVPTLGELYGSSPLVQGSPGLGVERGWTADAGLRATLPLSERVGRLSLESFAFVRTASDLVRFRRTGLSSATPYNVAASRILGLEAALAGELLAGQDAEKGGFARAVGPHEAILVAGIELQRDILEEDLLPEGLAKVGNRDHRAGNDSSLASKLFSVESRSPVRPKGRSIGPLAQEDRTRCAWNRHDR